MKSSSRYPVSCLALFLVLLLSNRCASGPDAGREPFAPARATLESKERTPKYRSVIVTEDADDGYVEFLRSVSPPSPAITLFRFHGVQDRGRPEYGVVITDDIAYLARAGDARVYDAWNDEDRLAFARAQRVRLEGLVSVRKFLRADFGLPPIDVEPADDLGRRYRFHVGTSGRPDPEPHRWRTLVLDPEFCPHSIEG